MIKLTYREMLLVTDDIFIGCFICMVLFVIIVFYEIVINNKYGVGQGHWVCCAVYVCNLASVTVDHVAERFYCLTHVF